MRAVRKGRKGNTTYKYRHLTSTVARGREFPKVYSSYIQGQDYARIPKHTSKLVYINRIDVYV